MAMKRIVCIAREDFGPFSSLDLTVGRIYQVLEETETTVRILDDTGEDYWYPSRLFLSADDDRTEPGSFTQLPSD